MDFSPWLPALEVHPCGINTAATNITWAGCVSVGKTNGILMDLGMVTNWRN